MEKWDASPTGKVRMAIAREMVQGKNAFGNTEFFKANLYINYPKQKCPV